MHALFRIIWPCSDVGSSLSSSFAILKLTLRDHVERKFGLIIESDLV